jgi:serine/threonine protein kinase
MDIKPNEVIGSYRILRPLGQGGMGAVFEVEHIKLGVHYALKVYTLENDSAELFRKKFAAEGRLLARLNHPNLVRVIDLDLDEQRGVLYYVMDLVLYKDGEARTLNDIRLGEADEDCLFDLFRQLSDALDYIHAQGIVHRDIKLDNILLAPDARVFLSDFGISRVVSERLRGEIGATCTKVTASGSGSVVGTHGYMAPEVLRGEPASAASDVYALGVAFFKLLTGVWYNEDLEPREHRTSTGPVDAVRLLADFERPWKDVLPAMLRADPAKRPTDLSRLVRRLEVAQHTQGSPTAAARRRRVLAVVLAAVFAIAALASLAVYLLPSNGQQPTNQQRNDDDALVRNAFALPESVK